MDNRVGRFDVYGNPSILIEILTLVGTQLVSNSSNRFTFVLVRFNLWLISVFIILAVLVCVQVFRFGKPTDRLVGERFDVVGSFV